jgi:hypothetical protein
MFIVDILQESGLLVSSQFSFGELYYVVGEEPSGMDFALALERL